MYFEFVETSINDVLIIKKRDYCDERGKLIKEYELTPFLLFTEESFREEYVTISKKNVLRGLHLQNPPKAQGKLVSVIKGEIFDVAVDLRASSSYYLEHVSKVISAKSNESIWIPPGFAHGFLSLTSDSIVINRCTNEFDQSLEDGLRWDDPRLDIKWPIRDPIVSEKDKLWKLL